MKYEVQVRALVYFLVAHNVYEEFLHNLLEPNNRDNMSIKTIESLPDYMEKLSQCASEDPWELQIIWYAFDFSAHRFSHVNNTEIRWRVLADMWKSECMDLIGRYMRTGFIKDL